MTKKQIRDKFWIKVTCLLEKKLKKMNLKKSAVHFIKTAYPIKPFHLDRLNVMLDHLLKNTTVKEIAENRVNNYRKIMKKDKLEDITLHFGEERTAQMLAY